MPAHGQQAYITSIGVPLGDATANYINGCYWQVLARM